MRLSQNEKDIILDLPFREILDAVAESVYVCDIDGQVVYINRSMSLYSGIDQYHLRDFSWMNHVHPEDVVASVKQWDSIMRPNPETKDYEVILRVKRYDDQYRRFRTSVNPLPDI